MKKRGFIAYVGGAIGMRRSPQGYIPESGLADLFAHVAPPGLAADMPEYTLHESSRHGQRQPATPGLVSDRRAGDGSIPP